MSFAQAKSKPPDRRPESAYSFGRTNRLDGGLCAPAVETAESSPLSAFYRSGPTVTLGSQAHVGSAGNGGSNGGRPGDDGACSGAAAGPALSLGGLVETKLTVGRANDPYEREADAVAELVVTDQPIGAISAIPSGGLNSPSQQEGQKEQARGERDLVQHQVFQWQVDAKAERQERDGKEPQKSLVQCQADEEEAAAQERPDEEQPQPLLLQRQTDEEQTDAEERLDEELPSQQWQRQAVEGEEDQIETPVREELQPLLVQRQGTEQSIEQDEEAFADQKLQMSRCSGTCA